MASPLRHHSRSQHQRLTWARRQLCPGCAKAFRTTTGLVYHLTWSEPCNAAYDAVNTPATAPNEYAALDRHESQERRAAGREKVQRIRNSTQPWRGSTPPNDWRMAT